MKFLGFHVQRIFEMFHHNWSASDLVRFLRQVKVENLWAIWTSGQRPEIFEDHFQKISFKGFRWNSPLEEWNNVESRLRDFTSWTTSLDKMSSSLLLVVWRICLNVSVRLCMCLRMHENAHPPAIGTCYFHLVYSFNLFQSEGLTHWTHCAMKVGRWWRKQVGFVGQEPILFDASVLDNAPWMNRDAFLLWPLGSVTDLSMW